MFDLSEFQKKLPGRENPDTMPHLHHYGRFERFVGDVYIFVVQSLIAAVSGIFAFWLVIQSLS